MTTDILELYQSIFEHQGIQFLKLEDNFNNIAEIDFGLRKTLFKNYSYNGYISILQQLTQENPIIFFHDKMNLDYCTFLLPEKWQAEYHTKYIIVGPIFSCVYDMNTLNAIIKSNGIPPKNARTCLEFYHRIPTITPINIWLSLFRPLLLQIYGSNVQYQFLELAPDSIDNLQFETDTDNTVSLSALENRYYMENQLLDAVSKGNNELALDWYRKFTNFKFTPRSYDPVRNFKNMLLILNTLLRKSMERANVHPHYIDQLSNSLAMKIEQSTSLSQLENMPSLLIRKYCLLVKNHSIHNYPEIIEKCIQYIDLHYQTPLTVGILAKYCSVTENYLSSAFHKKLGKTIIEYINEIRIEHSIILLNTTKASIQQIAEQCGFTNSNYYSRIFKKYKGITPLSYRKSIQT